MPGDGAIDDRPLTVAEFAHVAVQIAVATQDWHRREGPHLGLGRQAVLVDGDGRLHLADRDPATAADPRYAAPEQTGRLDRTVDERSDLYALGVLYYELLTGEPPFATATPADLRRCHLVCQPVPLGERVPGLPPVLDEIVLQLLAKSPDNRYQTARGLAIDLRLGAENFWDELFLERSRTNSQPS